MPTPKKAAPKKTKTKAAPKKPAAPKKVAPKKASAAPAPPAVKHRQIELSTNTGIYTLSFTDDATFEAAMAVVNSAPSAPTGARSPVLYTINAPDKTCSFHTISRYVVHES
jgi:hypothetical protein